MRVMIVDDATAIRQRIVSQIIRMPGIDGIMEAESGEQALAGAPAFAPDLVVLDLMLPGISGMEVLSGLKALDAPPEVAVFTNYPYSEFRLRSQELGAEHFLAKGSDVDALLAVVRERQKQALAESAPTGTHH